MLARSAVYALSLEERMASAGHIRLGEAISSRIPVVATAIWGLEEYLVDNVTSLRVRPGDAKGMADAITGLLADEEARLALGIRAKAYAQEFTRERYFRAIDRLLQSLPRQGRRPRALDSYQTAPRPTEGGSRG